MSRRQNVKVTAARWRHGRPLQAALLIVAATATLLGQTTGPLTPAAAAEAGPSGDFVSQAALVFDTTSGAGQAPQLMRQGQTATFPVLGADGLPDSGIAAVSLRLTAFGPTATTYLTTYPTGYTRPGTSNLNINAGSPGLTTTATVPLGSDDTISVFNQAGNVGVTIRVDGYFLDDSGTLSSTQGGFVPLSSPLLIDTRYGSGTPTAKLGANASVTYKLAGSAVPTGTRTALIMAIAVDQTSTGNITTNSTGGFHYQADTTAASFPVVLDSNGQATFKNNGSSAVNLVIAAQGYWAKTLTAGAGFRNINPARVVPLTPIASGATIDVQIGGAGPIPPTGVRAISATLTTLPGTATGNLQVWSKDLTSTPPPVSATNFTAGLNRAVMTTQGLGASGTLTVKNNSQSTVNLLVDVIGWYGDPLASTPPVDAAPTSILQMPSTGSIAGPVELAYVDNQGQLYHGYQIDPTDAANIQWTPDNDQEVYSGQPTLAAAPNGSTLVGAQHYDSKVYTQTSPTGPDWTNHLTDAGVSLVAPPVAATMPDGSAVIFGVDTTGTLWYLPGSSGVSRYWRNLGDPDLTGALTIVALTDGIQLAAPTSSGTVLTASFKNGALSAWTDLATTSVARRPSLVVDTAGRLRVCVVQNSGAVLVKGQDSTGAFTAWTRNGTIKALGAASAVLDVTSGKVLMFARNQAGYILQSTETARSSGTWGTWTRVANQSEPAATDPTFTVIKNVRDRTWTGVVRTADNSTRFILPRTVRQTTASTTVLTAS